MHTGYYQKNWRENRPISIRRVLLLASFTLLLQAYCYSQEKVYNGQVTNTTGTPLEFVNVMALTLPDSTIVGGAITDQDGNFSVVINLPHNDLLFRVSALGYKTLYLPTHAISTITLQEVTSELSEVVITAQRKPFLIEGNRVVCNISNSSLATESSVSDLLGKLPGFYMQGDQLKSFTHGSIQFFINDRPASNDAVYQLDIKSIKKVEIDRHPGARFSGEVGSVVYFYTHNPLEGISSFIRSYSRINHRFTQGLDGEFKIQRNRFSLTFGADYTVYQSKSEQENSFELLGKSNIWKASSRDTKERSRYTSQSYFIDLGYTPSDNHLLNIRYTLKPSKDDVLMKGSLNIQKGDKQVNEGFENANTEKSTSHNINLYYRWRLSKAWTIDIASDWYQQNRKSAYDLAEMQRLIIIHSTSNSSLLGASPRATYQSAQFRAELGADWSSSTVQSTTTLNIRDAQPTNNIISETKQAGYATLGYQPSDKWDLNLGLRYESTSKKYLDRSAPTPTEHYRYQTWLPSLAISYTNNSWRYQLSYNSTINYPSFSQLSSGDVYINRYNIKKSNSSLERSIAHDISGDISYQWLYLSAGYTYSYRPIFEVFRSEEIGNERRVVVTPQNLDQMQGLRFIANLAPRFSFYEPRVTLGYIQNFMALPGTKGNPPRHISKPFMILSLNNSFTLPKDWILSLDYSYNGSGSNGYIEYSSSSSLNASILKYLFDKRLQINLSFVDILNNSTPKISGTYENVRINSYSWMDTRSIRLNIIWRFNQHRPQRIHSSITSEVDRL